MWTQPTRTGRTPLSFAMFSHRDSGICRLSQPIAGQRYQEKCSLTAVVEGKGRWKKTMKAQRWATLDVDMNHIRSRSKGELHY